MRLVTAASFSLKTGNESAIFVNDKSLILELKLSHLFDWANFIIFQIIKDFYLFAHLLIFCIYFVWFILVIKRNATLC